MDQQLALSILMEGENVLLTGAAGSGKTYTLNEFIRRAKKAKKSVAVTATTGLAATHLGGSTIHSFSGIGIHQTLPRTFFEHLSKARRDAIVKADVLIIDEVSMLHSYRLDMVDTVLRTVRDKDVPFGGIQLVLSGDFFQLPPVTRVGEPPSEFVVSSSSYRDLDPVVCYLDEQYRQDDKEYLALLNSIRSGSPDKQYVDMLSSRIGIHSSEDMTELHTTNVDVDSLNLRKLKELDGEEHTYEAETTGSENYVETLKRSCLASDVLTVKIGALVMCIKNSLEKKFVNGSLGIITGFDEKNSYPVVTLHNERTHTIEPDSWELRDGDKKRAGLVQVPLRLAWAITVHKSQGMTLDQARMDLRRTFAPGMGYVALSRVRNLKSLYLIGINDRALRVSTEAIEIDAVLREKSVRDASRFESLRDTAKPESPDKPSNPGTGTLSPRVAKLRETWPKSYTKWTDDDLEKVKEMYGSNPDIPLSKICSELERHPGSIIYQIHKYFGEEAPINQ